MNVQSGDMGAQRVEDIGDKKQAIFESTLELIKEHGFHGAPMSLVAKNAGVAAGTIYHYFESKEQLICGLYNYNRDRLKDVISLSLRDGKSFKDKFFNVWNRLYRFYVQEPNVLIFFEQFVNSPFNVNKSPDYLRGELFSFFAGGIHSGQLKTVKPEMLLVLVMGSISSMAKLSVFGKVSLTKTDLSRIIEIQWEGIAHKHHQAKQQ